MITFIRNKLVSIHREVSNILSIHGVLDDDIYGLEMDIWVSIPDLNIVELKGKWNRWTTPECPRAIPFLQEAIGYGIKDSDFSEKIKKGIGRRSCRHFADLLLECCQCAEEAFDIIKQRGEYEETGHQADDVSQDNRLKKASDLASTDESGLERIHINEDTYVADEKENRVPGGMIIDLHTHSFPASPCSSVSVSELIKEAEKIGLDGICLTDHNHVWEPGKIEDLRQKYSFLVLGGNEITTDQGDMIVFGLTEDINTIITIQALKEAVSDTGGFMIAAHPFRGFLTFGVGRLGLTVETAVKRPVFRYVDALEILNGNVTAKENEFACTVADRLGLHVTGGSDAHELDKVGWYATRFSTAIHNESDLIRTLKDGNYSPITFRKKIRRENE